jgi:methylated-DNA-[protein]-cysteine S-methyltransferase
MKLFVDHFEDKAFGPVYIGLSEIGLRYIAFGNNASIKDVSEYAEKYNLEMAKELSITNSVKNQLIEYFQRTRKRFDTTFDIGHLTAFTQKVLMAAYQVSYGATSTYGNLAEIAGSKAAYRAVGQIMAKNPIPIIIPCHRILGSQGKLTGYAGGLDIKVNLLELEKNAANVSTQILNLF